MTSTSTVGADSASRPPNTRGSTFLVRRKRPLGVIALIATALFFITSPLATSQDDPSTPAAASAATPAPDSTRLELDFTELNDSGVSGTATLYEMGAQTLVELDLAGTGENHPAHIHQGTCEAIEPVSAYDLTNVGADGTSSTLVDVSLGDLLNGEFVVDLHLAPDQLGLLVACVDVEGTPVNAEGTPVAVGGETTPEATVEGTETPEATTDAATTEPETTATVEVTPEPTGAGGEVTPTAEATVPAEVTTTATPNDGTGGIVNSTTPTAGDGTDGGKGQAITPLTPAAVGGTNATSGKGDAVGGDGTNADGATVGSGKGIAVGGTSNLPANTGSGDSLLLPTTQNGAIAWATGGFALVLMASGWLLRRGETQTTPGRWRRLGL